MLARIYDTVYGVSSRDLLGRNITTNRRAVGAPPNVGQCLFAAATQLFDRRLRWNPRRAASVAKRTWLPATSGGREKALCVTPSL
jgi:hypothetical protein